MSALAWFGLSWAVFLAAVVYDLAWARYIRAAATGRPFSAAAWSATTYGIGLIGFLGVIRVSVWLALPELGGLFVGTYIGVALHGDRD